MECPSEICGGSPIARPAWGFCPCVPRERAVAATVCVLRGPMPVRGRAAGLDGARIRPGPLRAFVRREPPLAGERTDAHPDPNPPALQVEPARPAEPPLRARSREPHAPADVYDPRRHVPRTGLALVWLRPVNTTAVEWGGGPSPRRSPLSPLPRGKQEPAPVDSFTRGQPGFSEGKWTFHLSAQRAAIELSRSPGIRRSLRIARNVSDRRNPLSPCRADLTPTGSGSS